MCALARPPPRQRIMKLNLLHPYFALILGHFHVRENRDAHSRRGYSPWSLCDWLSATLQATTCLRSIRASRLMRPERSPRAGATRPQPGKTPLAAGLNPTPALGATRPARSVSRQRAWPKSKLKNTKSRTGNYRLRENPKAGSCCQTVADLARVAPPAPKRTGYARSFLTSRY